MRLPLEAPRGASQGSDAIGPVVDQVDCANPSDCRL
jgi:hypothetical protein